MNKVKSREIKGGGQEVAVMVGEWLKFNNYNLHECVASCTNFTRIFIIKFSPS